MSLSCTGKRWTSIHCVHGQFSKIVRFWKIWEIIHNKIKFLPSALDLHYTPSRTLIAYICDRTCRFVKGSSTHIQFVNSNDSLTLDVTKAPKNGKSFRHVCYLNTKLWSFKLVTMCVQGRPFCKFGHMLNP